MGNKTKLGIGTVQFGLDYGITNREGKTNQNEVCKILKSALDNNISCLDTASAYGDSEKAKNKKFNNNLLSK